jgi:HEAT repeat protein
MEARTGGSALMSALKGDADERVRESAAWALGQMEDRSAIEALGAAVQGDASARVRGTAAWAIGQLDDRGVRAPAGLLKALRDDSGDVRLKAAWALGQLEDTQAVSAIRDALDKEQDTNVRRALVRALVKSGGSSEQAMSKLLQSSDPRVREAAVRGLVGRSSMNPWPWPQPRPRPMP